MTEIRQNDNSFVILGIIVAALFSLVYLAMYALLIGHGTIYWYPAWSRAAAAVYVAAGILVQAGFCLFRGRDGTLASLLGQNGAGCFYLFVSLAHGGLYQS
jgi:hypothetical protein